MKNEKSLTEKIDAINLDALASKAIINRQIWKKTFLLDSGLRKLPAGCSVTSS